MVALSIPVVTTWVVIGSLEYCLPSASYTITTESFLIDEGDVGHVLFNVRELGSRELEWLFAIVDVNVVVHLVRVEVVAIYINTLHIES